MFSAFHLLSIGRDTSLGVGHLSESMMGYCSTDEWWNVRNRKVRVERLDGRDVSFIIPLKQLFDYSATRGSTELHGQLRDTYRVYCGTKDSVVIGRKKVTRMNASDMLRTLQKQWFDTDRSAIQELFAVDPSSYAEVERSPEHSLQKTTKGESAKQIHPMLF